MKKRKIAYLLSSMLLLFAVGCGKSADQPAGGATGNKEAIRITLGHPVPESHSLHKGYEKFKELVETRSNGELEVVIHAGGALGGDRQLAESINTGTIQMALNGSMTLGNYDSRMKIFDMPFFFDNNEEVDKIINGEVGKTLADLLPGTNIRVLAYPENGFRHITTKNKAINTAEDLKGLKIRAMETPVHIATFESLGMVPTSIPFPEVYSSLQSGVIDAQENAISQTYESKYQEVQTHLTIPGPNFLMDMTLINEQFYQSLTPEQQEIIASSAWEAAEYQREMNRKDNDEALEKLKQAGMEVSYLSDEEIQKLKEITKSVYKKFESEIDTEFLKAVAAELGRNPFE